MFFTKNIMLIVIAEIYKLRNNQRYCTVALTRVEIFNWQDIRNGYIFITHFTSLSLVDDKIHSWFFENLLIVDLPTAIPDGWFYIYIFNMAFFLLHRNTISSDVDNSRVVFGACRQAKYYMQSNTGLHSSMMASIRHGIIVEFSRWDTP